MDILQRGTLVRPLVAGAPISFKLTLSGPYIELELDGQVVITTLSAERRTGHLGVWVESGRVSIDTFQVAPLQPLNHA
jgi:hypothetical protein